MSRATWQPERDTGPDSSQMKAVDAALARARAVIPKNAPPPPPPGTLAYAQLRGALSILEGEAFAHGVALAEMISRGRTPIVVRAKHAAMVRLRTLGHSHAEIGRIMNVDHTTVTYAVKLAKAAAAGASNVNGGTAAARHPGPHHGNGT